MSNAKTNDNDPRFQDTADATHDDELSTDELDHIAGGFAALGPEAATDKGFAALGPEAAAGKGRMALSPEAATDKDRMALGPEKSA